MREGARSAAPRIAPAGIADRAVPVSEVCAPADGVVALTLRFVQENRSTVRCPGRVPVFPHASAALSPIDHSATVRVRWRDRPKCDGRDQAEI